MNVIKNIKWHLLLMAALGTLVFLLLYLTIFVTYYALVANPGQEKTVIDQFAQLIGAPFVFCTAPFVVYLTTRWLCRKAQGYFYTHAVLYVSFFWLIDLLTFASQPGGIERWFSFPWVLTLMLNSSIMLLAALLAAYLARKDESNLLESPA